MAGLAGTLALALVLWNGYGWLDAHEQPPATVSLAIGEDVFQAEIASTWSQRQRGLMGRTELAAGHGMLFVFEQTGRHCFWMRDTPLPLSIAFIDGAGRIDSLADMAPHTEMPHCPKGVVRYALEVGQGEFKRRGINPGMRIAGLPERK